MRTVEQGSNATIWLIISVLAIILALAGYGYWQYSIQESGTSVKEDIGDISAPPEAVETAAGNFSESGTLLDQNHETGEKGWTLMYEKPGMVILTASLVFDENSKCDTGEGLGPCDESKFEVGSICKLEGVSGEKGVTVITMKLTPMPQ